jgi:hypothetical protein
MFPRVLPLIAGCCFFVSVAVQGAEDGPAVDPDAILAELKAIKDGRNQTLQQALTQAINSIRELASTPANAGRAYMDAYKAVEFDGKPNGAARFAEWRKDKSDLLSTREFQTAAQLHLNYLLLSLQHVADPDNPAQIPAVVAYVNEYSEADRSTKGGLKKSDEAKNLLEKPVQDGVFAKAFQVSGLLAGQKDWEKAAGNLESILNNSVRAPLRAKNDPRLLETWDLQINLEKNSPTVMATDLSQTNFATIRLPQLQWKKATDAAALGQNASALLVMMEMIRKYPAHPDRGQWIEQATSLAQTLKG